VTCLVANIAEALDAEACRTFWVRRLHPAGPACVSCGCSLAGRQAETFSAGGRVHCRNCGAWLTYRTGTPLAGLALDDRQLAVIVTLARLNVPARQIAQAAGCSDDTVRRTIRRLTGGM